MARKYREIDPRIWSDEAFLAFTPTEKLVALYCLSCDQFSLTMAAEQTGLHENFPEAFKKVCHTLEWMDE